MKKSAKNLLIGVASIIVLVGATFGLIQVFKPQDDNAGGDKPPVVVENYLSAPKNIELNLNIVFSTQKMKNETKQIVSWDYVTNAEKFCVTIDGKDYYTTERTQQSYDITDKVTVGKTYEIKVKAIGDNVTYGDSGYTAITETVKSVSDNLVFTELEDGTYSVKKSSIDTVIDGELVLPDTYKGEKITAIEKFGFIENHAYGSLPIGRKGITNIRFPKYLKKIDAFAFSNCIKLKTINLPSSVIEYGKGVFENCKSLINITFPEDMSIIPNRFCSNCSSLKKVDLPKNLEKIENNAFELAALESIEIPDSVIEIGTFAFSNTFIKTVKIPAGLKILGGFDSTKIEEITIPASVERIGNHAFSNCEFLTKVEFEEGSQLTEIGVSAFSQTALTEIDLPDSVEIIGGFAFQGSLLESFEIPAMVTSIGDATFRDTNLTSIEIPANIISIGENAFQDTLLTEVVLHEGLQEIGNFAFANSPLTKIEIPASVTNIGYGVFAPNKNSTSTKEIIGGKLEEITVAQGNESFKIIDGSLYTIDGQMLVYYLATKTDKEYTTPNGLKTIIAYAFSGVKNLEEIVIGESVTKIGSYAFENCTSLKSLQFPDNELYIGENFIKGCTSLTLVQIPKGADVHVKDTPCKYIEFLDGKVEIISLIWNNDRKPQIIIPKSVTKISGISVGNLGGALNLPVTIFYKGTAEDWANVELVNMGTNDITVYYYLETEPPLNSDGTAYDGNYWYYGADGVPKVWEYQGSE